MEKVLRLTSEQRADLVAYLDGELDESPTQEIDRILARSAVARHEVEALSRAWEMLDILPRPKASSTFTERTMSTLQLAEAPRDFSGHPLVALRTAGWLQDQSSRPGEAVQLAAGESAPVESGPDRPGAEACRWLRGEG